MFRFSCIVLYAVAFTLVTGCDSTESPRAPIVGTPIEGPDTKEPNDPVINVPPTTLTAGDAAMRLLTRYEYDFTVEDLLGDATRPAQTLAPENQAKGFENFAAAHQVSPLLVRQYMEVAEDIASRAVEERRDSLLPCAGRDGEAEAVEDCGRAFLDDFLWRAFRRPVAQEEREVFDRLFLEALERDGMERAVEMVIEVVLQSPQFLYRMEAIDPASPVGTPQHVSPYAMATRLSYFLWASMPDETLLEEAKKGGLQTEADILAQAERMLADPRAKRMVKEFHRQWLGYDVLDSLVRDTQVYPDYTPGLSQDWRIGLDAFIDHTFWGEPGTFESLLTDPTLFLTADIAEMYGADVGPEESLVAFKADPLRRSGLLTQPGLLAILAHANQTSPVKRGVFVREKILCEHLPPPPANLAIMPPELDPQATTRERFAAVMSESTCAGCHTMINPIGFAFEHYDSLGRWRDDEYGLPINTDGEIVGARESVLQGEFQGAVEMAARLANSRQAHDCMTQTWLEFALGRSVTEADVPSLEELQERFFSKDGDLKQLLLDIVLSDTFRYRTVQDMASSEK